MYAITGVTGQVGGHVAKNLLAAGKSVRAIVRNSEKAQAWTELGCEAVIADLTDTESLTKAFQGMEAVFILLPPNFDPSPHFTEAHALARSLKIALEAAQPKRVVYLSTIGAQASEENLLTQHSICEKELRKLSLPITFLRPGWFMENCLWDIVPAKDSGIVPSFLQPLEREIPMIATADIGKLAADLLQETIVAHRIVELEGPERISPLKIAAAFSSLLQKEIRMEIVPRNTWMDSFISQGMKNPLPRLRMLDGFNEGWICFETKEIRKGQTSLRTVLEGLLNESNN